jgi:hypothetical protein
MLGLGSQVKAHITRRFSMLWGRPAVQMREFVLAMRAAWRSWSGGAPLNFEGEHYRHTLISSQGLRLGIAFSILRIIFSSEPGGDDMAWDFETDPEYQKKLDWADEFVRAEVEPLDYLFPQQQFVPMTDTKRKIIDPLKDEVRRRGLWATHLGPELGGQGFGQLKLALLNEILGRSPWASTVFGTQAPDTGNAEIIAHFGTPEQKERYLQPLLDGELFSSYSMTEPQAGADPTQSRPAR